ncbi:hypothetical protein IFM89_012584 [Coptis chinensis]|uniref:Uncharacterized protein n=1 Tax=Coptis chinensis TaxID=261450 RepID=A0A835H4P8_9MAGN|nr:hypothetical protein IFM89_012584 [Coptis chinensis]
MDEQEFGRVLSLFPIVRSRDYHPESESSRESTSCMATDELSEWQDAWGEDDKRETEIQGIDRDDPFWEKLKLAAERKVCEEPSMDAAESFKSLTSLD